MKKFLLLLAAVAMIASSCQKDCDCGTRSYDFEILSGDWKLQLNDEEEFYYYTFNFPELTSRFDGAGQVTATRYFEGGIQSPLGETRHFGYDDNGQLVEWTETVRMQYVAGDRNHNGEITFIASFSDYTLITRDFQPPYMKFRVTLSW